MPAQGQIVHGLPKTVRGVGDYRADAPDGTVQRYERLGLRKLSDTGVGQARGCEYQPVHMAVRESDGVPFDEHVLLGVDDQQTQPLGQALMLCASCVVGEHRIAQIGHDDADQRAQAFLGPKGGDVVDAIAEVVGDRQNPLRGGAAGPSRTRERS